MKFFFFKLILNIMSWLPLKIIHRLGNIVGRLTWVTNSRIRRIAQRNIQLCFPDLDEQQQPELVQQILNETGKVILETGRIWNRSKQSILDLIIESEGEELIKQAQDSNRGVIIALPHYGSWELVGLYCAEHYSMTSMYAPQEDPQLNQFIKNARQRTGANLVATDIKGIRAMSKALKKNELVAILPDQSPSDNGLYVPFFGHDCYTMTLLPKLAKKTNAIVLYTYAQRLPDSSGFKIIFRAASEDIATLELEDATKKMNLDIEKIIRENPHQYQWTYKRFKKQPEGNAAIY